MCLSRRYWMPRCAASQWECGAHERFFTIWGEPVQVLHQQRIPGPQHCECPDLLGLSKGNQRKAVAIWLTQGSFTGDMPCQWDLPEAPALIVEGISVKGDGYEWRHEQDCGSSRSVGDWEWTSLPSWRASFWSSFGGPEQSLAFMWGKQGTIDAESETINVVA